MSRPQPLTDEQMRKARELYECGEVPLTEAAKRSGIHYLRLIGLADKLGWVRRSSVEEINTAREMAGRGLQRKAIEYLCRLIPTGNSLRDDDLVAETKRMRLILDRRAITAAREAAQG